MAIIITCNYKIKIECQNKETSTKLKHKKCMHQQEIADHSILLKRQKESRIKQKEMIEDNKK